MMKSVTRRKYSILAIMLVFGFAFSSWVTRTPAVKSAVDASTATMGMILFGISVGSMLGVVSSGPLTRRYGARAVLTVGTTSGIAGVGLIAAAVGFSNPYGLFFGLLFFGAGSGLCEIALNIEGAAIEEVLGRPVLPALHGCFSLGTVVGALVGLLMTAVSFPVVWHLAIAAVLMLLVSLWAVPGVPARSGVVARAHRGDSGSRQRERSIWRDPVLVLIAVVVLATAFAEGSANDWLPILIVDTHAASETLGSLVFAGFALTMTIGRFLGTPAIVRFGRARVLQLSMLIGLIGVLGVVFAPNVVVSAVAVVFWGLGAALGFPVAISAAGMSEDRSSQRVSAVTSAGYLAFLVGPPLLGFVGENWGLSRALLIVAGLLVIAAVASTQLVRLKALDS